MFLFTLFVRLKFDHEFEAFNIVVFNSLFFLLFIDFFLFYPSVGFEIVDFFKVENGWGDCDCVVFVIALNIGSFFFVYLVDQTRH